MLTLIQEHHQLESRMREIRSYGSEGGGTVTPFSLPLSKKFTGVGYLWKSTSFSFACVICQLIWRRVVRGRGSGPFYLGAHLKG